MNINRIEEIYRYSFRKYEDLYDYFYNNCEFQITSTKLSLGYDTIRIRDYMDLKEIQSKVNVQYPPTSTSFTRIGKPNQIWFYISDDFNASVSEMLPSWYSKIRPGDDINIIISVWHVRQEIKVLIIPDLNNLNETCKKLDLQAYNLNRNFWTYICNKFRTTTLESKNIYEFTSAFANSVFDRAIIEGKDMEGFFYPSVQYPTKSNIALIKSTVDNEKIVLKYLDKTIIHKSRLLNIYGTPNYKQICDFNHGFYEPEGDEFEWD